MIPAKFFPKADYRISRGYPVSSVYDLATEMGIERKEVDAWLQERDTAVAKKEAIGAGQEAIYNTIDATIAEKHPHLVVYRRGDNNEFYEYRNGVYVNLPKQDIRNLVDDEMYIANLHTHRANRKKVADTVDRLASTLTRLKRVHTDESISGQEWRINLANGLLDTNTGTLEPHSPRYFSTSQVPFPYDPTQEPKEFKTFLSKVSGGDDVHTEMLQQMFGYCLGDGNPKHKVFYLYGSTARNGKSTAAKILMGLLGNSNCSTLSLSQLSNENNRVLQSLVGKQLNFSDEVSSKYIESSLLTTLSAEGIIEIDPKYKDPYMYQVRSKFIIACNDIPRFESGQGMLKRMVVIPFTYHLKEDERIDRYDEKLLQTEGSGILNWAIEGMQKYKDNTSFVMNNQSIEDLNNARKESNPVYAYLEETYTFTKNDSDMMYTDTLYGESRLNGGKDNSREPSGYYEYCEKAGIKPMSRMKFAKEVARFASETGKMEAYRVKNNDGSNGLRGYRYIIKETDF
jgi:putative DNA primase/helicase